MTSDSPQSPDTSIQGRDRTWGTRKTVAAAVVAVAIAGLGGAAIYAATAGSSHTMGSHGPFAPGGGPPPPGASGAHPMGAAATPAAPVPPPPASQPGPAGTLHGEYVVSDGSGGFVTRLTQTGIVDEITPTTVVVRSADGFTEIYGYPHPVTNPSVAVNDTVTVDATRAGTALTLTNIGEAAPQGN